MNKTIERLRRAKRTRMKIKQLGVPRLSVHRTPRHIYAQLIEANGGNVIVCASSLDKEVSGNKKDVKGSVGIATLVGELVAKRAKSAGHTKIAFDRSGFKYHGRIKALADAARAHGLEF
jgi:large subunit ribosomal protein L18